MSRYLFSLFLLLAFTTANAQVLINPPTDSSAQLAGSVDFENIEIPYSHTASDAVHGTMLGEHLPGPSYITCIGTADKRVTISYITTRAQIGNRNVLGNFSFESFEKCKFVALKMADNPGLKVRFKLILDRGDGTDGKISAIEWLQ